MLRIIAGTAKNRKIEVPESARPITDRIRTSMFDTINDFLPDAQVLDLFSGSGAFAIEALSRGSKNAVIIDVSSKAIEIIKHNLIHVGFADQAIVHNKAVEEYLLDELDKGEERGRFDIIMVDPPFAMPAHKKFRIVENAAELLSTDSVLIFRFPSTETQDKVLEGYDMVYTKKYGVSTVNYYKPATK